MTDNIDLLGSGPFTSRMSPELRYSMKEAFILLLLRSCHHRKGVFIDRSIMSALTVLSQTLSRGLWCLGDFVGALGGIEEARDLYI